MHRPHTHGFLLHCYADDMQVYIFGRPIDTATLKKRVLACIGDIDSLVACNRIKLYPAESEFLWSATARCLHLADNSMFHFEDGDVTQATTACTMVPHVGRLVRAGFYQLRRLRAIRRSIKTTTVIQVIRKYIDNENIL